jgi:prevent-host-death family protein
LYKQSDRVRGELLMRENAEKKNATLGRRKMEIALTLTVTEARKQFSDLVSNVVYSHQPAVITRSGKKTVALVPYEVLERFIALEAINDINKARKALSDFKSNGGITLEDLKKELGVE